MNLMRINGKIYNLDKMEIIQYREDEKTLVMWTHQEAEPRVESGPEALAAWEWLQKACIWKMETGTLNNHLSTEIK